MKNNLYQFVAGNVTEVHSEIVEDVSKISNICANNVNSAPSNGNYFRILENL